MGRGTSKIGELEKKLSDLENKWKRALADYDNLKKRLEREKEEFVKFSTAGLLDKLLPVLDSLEKWYGQKKEEGVKLILEQFRKVLESEGLKEIEAVGKTFDPLMMDAVAMGKGEKNKVIEVIMKGYQLNGKVLRPAKVKVGAGKED